MSIKIDRRKEPKIKTLDIEKNRKLILDVLLPAATLDKVGKEWGLTRERIRQIFQRVTGHNPGKLRQKFLQDSTLFRCPICGTPVNPRGSKYCSRTCYAVSCYYDMSTIRKCVTCGKGFYPLRNWKSIKMNKGEAGKYCSRECFVKNMNKLGKWGRRKGFPLPKSKRK